MTVWSDGEVMLLDSSDPEKKAAAPSKDTGKPEDAVLQALPDDVAVLVLKLRKRYTDGKTKVLAPEPSWRKASDKKEEPKKEEPEPDEGDSEGEAPPSKGGRGSKGRRR